MLEFNQSEENLRQALAHPLSLRDQRRFLRAGAAASAPARDLPGTARQGVPREAVDGPAARPSTKSRESAGRALQPAREGPHRARVFARTWWCSTPTRVGRPGLRTKNPSSRPTGRVYCVLREGRPLYDSAATDFRRPA